MADGNFLFLIFVSLVVTAGILSPIFLVAWDVLQGHHTRRGRPLPLRFSWARNACWSLLLTGLLLFWMGSDPRVEAVACTAIVAAMLLLAARSIFDDIRGSAHLRRKYGRTAVRDAEAEAAREWHSDVGDCDNGRQDADDDAIMRRTPWWTKWRPAIRFSRYGIWK